MPYKDPDKQRDARAASAERRKARDEAKDCDRPSSEAAGRPGMKIGPWEFLAAALVMGGIALGQATHDNSALVIGFAGISIVAARVIRSQRGS